MVDTSAYLVELNLDEITVDEFLEMMELIQGISDKDASKQLAAMVNIRDALAPFVKRQDGEPLADGEGQRFIGALKFSQLNQVLEGFGKSAVPPQNGSAS